LFVMIFHAIGMKLKKTDMQLTQKEKDTLAPVLQKCLDQLMINFNNPWNALAITVGIIYGSKAMEKGVVSYIDKKNDEKAAKENQQQASTVKDELLNKVKQQQENAEKEQKERRRLMIENWHPSEEEIKKRVKEKKQSREIAIRQLKANYKKLHENEKAA